MDNVSDAGRKIVYTKRGTFSAPGYTQQQISLPTDYDGYDEVQIGISDSSQNWGNDVVSVWLTLPTIALSQNSALSNIDNKNLNWGRSSRVLQLSRTNDRFLRVILTRGQGPTGAAGADGAGTTLSSVIPARPTRTGAAGTSPNAAHGDHAHPAELGDDTIPASYAQTSTPAQQLAWRQAIGEVGFGQVPYNSHRLTVADDPNDPGEDRGYQVSGPAYGAFTPTTFAVGGVTYTVQALFRQDDDLICYIAPVPTTTGAEDSDDWALLIDGQAFLFSDASRVRATDYGAAATLLTWTGRAEAIPAAGQTVTVEIAGPVEREIARVRAEAAGHRQVPASPSSPADPTDYWLRGDNTFQQLPTVPLTPYESDFLLSITTTRVTTTAQVKVPLVTANIDTGSGITLVNGELRFARTGLYFVDWSMEFILPSPVQTLWKIGNNFVKQGSARLYTDPADRRAELVGRAIAVITAANQQLSLWWEPLELTSSGTIPPSPSAIGAPLTVLPGPPPHLNLTWTYNSATTVDTWELQWSLAGENDWQPWQSVPNNTANTIRDTTIQLPTSSPIDVRIRGRNAAGPGSYSQRTAARTGVPATFTRQSVPAQTIRATGGVAVRSLEAS